MNVKIDWQRWLVELPNGSTHRGEGNWQCEWLRAMMMAEFEAFISSVGPEEFQRKYGAVGTEVLAYFTK